MASTFGQHVVFATLPVLKISLLGSVGALLARTGVLDPAGRRVLSRLIFVLFTPCLTFTKLAPVLSARHLLAWMPLALNLFLNVAVGLLLGVLLLAIVRPPAGLRCHVVAASGLGNAGNLPLVLVAALVQESGGALFGGEPISEGLAIAYVAVGIWAATLTHFSIGTQLLKLPEQQQQQQPFLDVGEPVSSECDEATDSRSGALHRTASRTVELGPLLPARAQQQPQPQAEQRHSLASGSRDSLASSSSADCIVLAGAEGSGTCSHCGALSCEQAGDRAWCCSACGSCKAQSPEQQQPHWREASSRPVVGEQASLLGCGPHLGSSGQEQQHVGSSNRSRLAAVGGVAWDLLSALASPPMVGCLLAVAVGMTRPLRDALFEPGGSLLMIQDCVEMFGQCCIPSLLLMLGVTLSKGPGEAKVPARVVLGVAAVRLVVLPLLGTAWLVAAKATGWLAAPDKWFVLVMLIQNAVPTALNVHTLATLFGNREADLGAMLFWQYIAACITLPAALSGFLWLLNQALV